MHSIQKHLERRLRTERVERVIVSTDCGFVHGQAVPGRRLWARGRQWIWCVVHDR